MTDTAPDLDGQGTFRLMYRSRNLIPPDHRRVALGELFSIARSNNKRRRICGALLVQGDWFVQVLEGEEEAVRGLYDRIVADPRHADIVLLDTGTVDGRVFARWAMARMSERGEPDLPLIAHADGIAPAAGRGTTPEQERVLEAMREATRRVGAV